MFQNIVACDLLLLILSSLGFAATSIQPSSIRPQSTYLPADLVSDTNSSYFIQARKINAEEILLHKNITYSGHGLFVDKLVGDVQPYGGTVQASYGPFRVFQSDFSIFNSTEIYNLNIQTHILTKTIQAYSPSLNMFFHLDHKQFSMLHDLAVCVDLHIFYTKGEILSSCMLSKSTGCCFLDVPIPMDWWLEISDTSYQNSKMQLSYSISKSVGGECRRKGNSLKSRTMSTTQRVEETRQAPPVYLGEIPLQPLVGHYTPVNDDSRIIIKVPDNKDVNPTHGFLIPVSIPQDYAADSFSIKIKPRKGLKVNDIYFHNIDLPWQHSNSSDEESTTVSFTLTTAERLEAFNSRPPLEVPIFLVEFKVMNDTSHSRHISWKIDEMKNGEVTSTKTATKINLSRGKVLALIPIAEKSELLNTAVLNHEPVMAELKVFAISEDHAVLDVTSQSVCSSADDNILKVQHNCSYVFLDGSEDGSTSDVRITARFQGKSVDLGLCVWMPEQLTIELSDQKLSLIKEWKVPYRGLRRYRRSLTDNKCKLRYQQATVTVYTRFYTKHANSGRKVYMFNKDIREDVTNLLTTDQITTSDPKVATVDNLIVYGHSDGVVSVQILKGTKSIAHKELTVGGRDKVSVTDLHISMVTGLSMQSVKNVEDKRLKAVRVKAYDQLIAKYQEGILDVTLGFSDGAILPLRHVSTEDYYIKTVSHNRNIVMERLDDSIREARVIAIGEGATTVNVELQLPRMCHKKHKPTNVILSRIYPVNVSFAAEDVQNSLRRIGEEETSINKAAPYLTTGDILQQGSSVDLGIVHVNFDPSTYDFGLEKVSDGEGKKKDKVFSIPLDEIPFGSKDDVNNDPHYDNDEEEMGNLDNELEDTDKSSAMEIGMYVMLTVFALAIIVFLLNCMVYMYRIGRRKKAPPSVIGSTYTSPNESWSWLGRQVDSDAVFKRHNGEACDCGEGKSDVPMTQVYTESEVSVEHHSTSCSESPVESGHHDISETNMEEEEEEINVADEPPPVDSDPAVSDSKKEEPEEVIEARPAEENPLLEDIKVTVNPLPKDAITEHEEPMEYNKLLKHLQALQEEILA
ncbi:transmembrane protein 132B-like [Anneissia japonica]|uniref:transmembrane protein 132B-like n=1 Tax=Anneissia japonica TaxID=1529436 RepID=UPI0014257CE5|nr:transmembrane protein 132B-like [Anneissia japonica]